MSGLFINIHECLAGVCVGGNASPSVTIAKRGKVLTITTEREFVPQDERLIRGAFPNKQSGAYVAFGSDGHTIMVTAEQEVRLAVGDTFNFLIPATWRL